MSEIKSGDLVMVVKTKPCCGTGRLGYTFTAASNPFRSSWVCLSCGRVNPEETVIETDEGNGRIVSVDRIKKIDPPAEGDDLPTRRDLHNNIRRESHAPAVNGA